MIDINETEKEISEAVHAGRKGKRYECAPKRFFEDANEPFECWRVLRELSKAIECLWMLSDEYYRIYIWNAGCVTQEQLKQNGLADDDFYLDTAKKLETLRAILFGHNADWDTVMNEIYDNLLAYEVSAHKNYETMFDDVVRKRDKLENEIRGLKAEMNCGAKMDATQESN